MAAMYTPLGKEIRRDSMQMMVGRDASGRRESIVSVGGGGPHGGRESVLYRRSSVAVGMPNDGLLPLHPLDTQLWRTSERLRSRMWFCFPSRRIFLMISMTTALFFVIILMFKEPTSNDESTPAGSAQALLAKAGGQTQAQVTSDSIPIYSAPKQPQQPQRKEKKPNPVVVPAPASTKVIEFEPDDSVPTAIPPPSLAQINMDDVVDLNARSPVTIVSSFYKVENGKKHKVEEYKQWLSNFLDSVELPIIFYCAPNMERYIKQLRGTKPILIISTYDSPFQMPPVKKLGGRDWALAQHKMDPERNIHVPDLYAIWTAKPWMVQQAKEVDPYLSEYFFWVDAGSFRDRSVTHTFNGLPRALDAIYSSVPDDTLLLASTTIPFEEGTAWVKAAVKSGEMDRQDVLQGGWYGGKKAGIDWWAKATMKVTALQAAMHRFAAKEQPVWTHAARLNWEKIYVQNMALRTGPDCGPDMWFGFEYFADGRECKIPVWNGPAYAKLETQGSATENRFRAGADGRRIQKEWSG